MNSRAMNAGPGKGASPTLEIEYPASDGEPMAETGPHAKALIHLFVMLRRRYRGQRVYVAADMFLYVVEGDPTASRAPDLMVIKGVPAEPERASFFTWKEQAIPCVVIEITSEKTREEDTGAKKEFYQKLGIREYFLFDPLGDYLPKPLMGYRLLAVADNGNGDLDAIEVRHAYEELPHAADGSLSSAELGLRLVPQGEELLLFDTGSGEQLLPPDDAYEQMERYRHEVDRLRERAETAEKAQKEAWKAQREAEQAQKKAEQAQREAEQAQKKAEKDLEQERLKREQVEQELERLKRELAGLQQQPKQGPAAEGSQS